MMDVDCKEHLSFKETDVGQLQAEETDDSCKLEFTETEIFPVTKDADCSCKTDCVSGDWSAEVICENLAVVKHEPDDVCWIMSAFFNTSQQKQFLDTWWQTKFLELFYFFLNCRKFIKHINFSAWHASVLY